nr:RHS repeat-associated core domain-containing protein [Chloroflexia bacterium]
MPGLGLISSTDTSRTQGYYHTDASGATVAKYEYDAFGALRNQTGTASGAFRFTGEQLDLTGLYFLRAMYYDPAKGRFLSRNPFPGYADDPRTLNPYAYAGNVRG